MGFADADSMTARICAELGSQWGAMFRCSRAGERVQIRTPFVFPDGDLIDLYWRDTDAGPVVSDLGDTYGWLFINGGNDGLTAEQNRAYDEACQTYGVERRGGVLLARVSDGKVADAVVRLAQAITAVSQVLDRADNDAVLEWRTGESEMVVSLSDMGEPAGFAPAV